MDSGGKIVTQCRKPPYTEDAFLVFELDIKTGIDKESSSIKKGSTPGYLEEFNNNAPRYPLMKDIIRASRNMLGETYSLPETIEQARFKAKKPEPEDPKECTAERLSISIAWLHLQRVQRSHGQPYLAAITRDDRTVAEEFSA